MNDKRNNMQKHIHLLLMNSHLFFRPLLKQIKNSGVAHIVLDCSTDKIYNVLKQSQQIGMMSDYHSYLITSLVHRNDCLFSRFCSTTFVHFLIASSFQSGSSNNRLGRIQIQWHEYNRFQTCRSR